MAERLPDVLVLSPDYPPVPGGIQILVHRLAANLTRLRPLVVAIDADGATAFDADAGLAVVRAGRTTRPHRANIASANAAAVIAGLRRRPDVILAAHIVTSPAARLLSNLLRVPYAVFVHADEIGAAPRLARFAITGAAAVLGPSRHTIALAEAIGARPERCHVALPGVDPAERRASPERGDPPTILTVARLEKRYKGHDVVARALPLVRAAVPAARWVVVGDGPLRPTVEALCATFAVDDAVHFTGRLSDAERDAWFARSSVFTMPSRLPGRTTGGEGFGIVYVEASAWGLPVVAGDVGGARDAVVNDETGLLVDPTDHVAVADALTAVLCDDELARRLGAHGVAHAGRLTWQRFATQVEDVLLGLLR